MKLENEKKGEIEEIRKLKIRMKAIVGFKNQTERKAEYSTRQKE